MRFETPKYALVTDSGRYVSGVTDCHEDGIVFTFDSNPSRAALWSAEDISLAQSRVIDFLRGEVKIVNDPINDGPRCSTCDMFEHEHTLEAHDYFNIEDGIVVSPCLNFTR